MESLPIILKKAIELRESFNENDSLRSRIENRLGF